MEGGGATLDPVTNMELRSEVERKRFAAEAEAAEFDGSDTDAKTLPNSRVVLYHDLLQRLWGWDRLVPFEIYVPWTEYTNYLQVYYSHNASKLLPAAAAAPDASVAALAETCLLKEKNLAAAWKFWRSDMDIIALSKSIILNCLIHECVQSVIRTAGCKFSDVCSAALMCISKETDLTCELMWRGADPMVDYLFKQSSQIRLCALSLMSCLPCYSVAASAAMLGIAKEAQVMCDWMREENTRIDFLHGDFIPKILLDSRRIRRRTLDVLIKILEESSPDGHKGVNSIPFHFTIRRGCISDVPNSQDQNTKEAEKCERGNMKGEDFLEKLWGWERLLPLHSYVRWSDYSNYLEKYYNHNALNFIDEAVANLNLKEPLLYHPFIRGWQLASKVYCCPAASVAIFCLMMEEELVSEWKARVERSGPDSIFLVNTFIHSSLIKEHVISICGTWDGFSIPSAVVFVCLTEEADLMIELLKHGAAPGNDILEQSGVIRMCALGLLVNIKGHQSIAATAAMLGMAKEARVVHDWIKRENKLPTSLTETRELEKASLIRTRTLDVAIDILQASSFPSC